MDFGEFRMGERKRLDCAHCCCVVGLGGVREAKTNQRTTVVLFSLESDRWNVDSDDERMSSSIEGHLVDDKGELDELWVIRYED